jgi:peptide deformylase
MFFSMEIITKSHASLSTALSTVAKEVPFGKDVSQLVDDMWLTLRKTTGVGLAANQVGNLSRVILVNTNGFVQEIINPQIIKGSSKFKNSTEGCLSVPNKHVIMKRESIVTVIGYDKNWVPVKKKCRGLLANIIQHEIDHLNGVMIDDKF